MMRAKADGRTHLASVFVRVGNARASDRVAGMVEVLQTQKELYFNFTCLLTVRSFHYISTFQGSLYVTNHDELTGIDKEPVTKRIITGAMSVGHRALESLSSSNNLKTS